jgi:hypothetical protein
MPDPADLKNWLASANESFADPRAAFDWMRVANGRGEYVLAISFARRALEGVSREGSGSDWRPVRQQLALALARSGSLEAARQVLESIDADGHPDAETLGLLGRVHKDFAEKSSAPEMRRDHLERAREFYLEGFELHGDTYCGINAAALSVFTGRLEVAKALAAEVAGLLPADGDHWHHATLGEAMLILGHHDEARRHYLEASRLAGTRRADFASSRRQCFRLGQALGGGADGIAGDLPRGAVAVFAGHRPDLPGRRKPRLPAEALPGLRQRMLDWLETHQVHAVYSSAAAGSDLLFLECAAQRGLETHVFLPYPKEDVIRRSVADCGDEWVARFESALDQAHSVTLVEDQTPEDDGAALRFCIRILTAGASSMATAVDCPLLALAVWDGLPAAGPGGTADSVSFWNGLDLPVRILHPTDSHCDSVRAPARNDPAERPFPNIYAAHPERVGSEVAVMLGLCAGGYENLADSGFIALDRDVFGAVADLFASRGWAGSCHGGFGEYLFAWDSTGVAGLAALEILDVLEREAGARGLALRFSLCLHVAPMQTVVNPLLNIYSLEGRAAVALREWTRRLPHGVAHATGRFAHLAALEKAEGFFCTQAGSLDPLGEPFGFELHRLHRTRAVPE